MGSGRILSMSVSGSDSGRGSSHRSSRVNLPALVGVIVVFLAAVLAWVLTSDRGPTDSLATATDPPVEATTSSSAAPTTVVEPVPTQPLPDPVVGTSPIPLPIGVPNQNGTRDSTVATSEPVGSTTIPRIPIRPTASTAPGVPTATTDGTAPATTGGTAPTTTIGAATSTTTSTTIPDRGSGVPVSQAPNPKGSTGDVGVRGHPIAAPRCDDTYVAILSSFVGDDATSANIGAALEVYDGSEYLRTDTSCSSLTQSMGGNPIYILYFGPYKNAVQACAAVQFGPPGSYVRRLSDEIGPGVPVSCDG